MEMAHYDVAMLSERLNADLSKMAASLVALGETGAAAAIAIAELTAKIEAGLEAKLATFSDAERARYHEFVNNGAYILDALEIVERERT